MGNNIMRMTGMVSGMDTESIVSALTSTYKTKVDKAKKEQTKLEWKQEAWKDLNSKVYSLYSGKLSSMRYTTAFNKKAATSSSSALSVIAGDSAANGSQSVKIKSMAKAGNLTGAEITDAEGNKVTQDTLLKDLGIDVGTKISIKCGDTVKDIEVTEDMTMYGFTSALREAGVNANFDVDNKRLFVSSKDTGAENDFSITCDNADVLNKLGISEESGAKIIKGSDAELELNGATFKSNSNTFKINGSTYTINSMTDDEITVNTKDDTSGIYDMVKDVLNQYNDTLIALSKAYNVAANSYEPLSEDEKAALSDKQIEDWEKMAKEDLLRHDSSINEIMSAMKSAMADGVEIDGEKYYLSDFGISTLGYLYADENERYAYHIDGNPDDANSSGKTDKLKAMIASDPQLVTDFFTKLSQNLYGAIDEKMKSTDYSSVYKVYDDKKMKLDYDAYTTKIKELEQKFQDAEDRYYKRFTAMETMLASMQSKTDSISALFG